MNNEAEARPNIWALRLIERIANNLFLRSKEINEAYRHCITALDDENRRQRRTLVLVKPEE